MSTKTMPNHKRGNSYALTCTYKEAGSAVDVSNMTFRCQMRNSAGKLVAAMTITKDPDQVTNRGKFTIAPTVEDTTGWQTGNHLVDIEITDSDGTIRSSDTFYQPVIEDVTR